MVLIGAGQGASLSPLTSAGIVRVRPADAGAASGMVNVAHQVGGSLGLGVLVTVFASANAQHLAGDAAFAHQVSVALTAGAVMLSAAFALVVAVVGTTLLLPSRPDRAHPRSGDRSEQLGDRRLNVRSGGPVGFSPLT